MQRTGLWYILVAIGAMTVLSGGVQMLWPALVLGVVGGEATAASRHFFGIVGMFMVLFGGLLCHALASRAPQAIPVLWAALQKFGASVAVALGVWHGVLSTPALGVAGFDLLSGVLAMMYWRTVSE